MKYFRNILIITTAAVFLFSSVRHADAIGEFALGVNAGVTYDPNGMEQEIERYNLAMAQFRQDDPGSSISQIKVPYSPVFGFNVRYQFNFIFMRLGTHYTRPLQSVKGKVTDSLSDTSKINIETYQASFPATVGLLIPLSGRTHFFIGAGPTYHQSYISITQSDPAVSDFPAINSALSDNRRDRYSATFVGYHLIVGAEIPVHEKFSISLEWIHQQGRSHPIKNDGLDSAGTDTNSPSRNFNVRGDFLIFGLNYYISL